jgi:hypothetical protein
MFTKSIALNLLSILAITTTAVPILAAPDSSLPRSGTVLKMTNGDIMCYIELRDVYGNKRTVGADFDLCDRPKKFLNRKVKLTYGRVKVSDCESAEPCGKTRWETLVVRLKLPQ